MRQIRAAGEHHSIAAPSELTKEVRARAQRARRRAAHLPLPCLADSGVAASRASGTGRVCVRQPLSSCTPSRAHGVQARARVRRSETCSKIARAEPRIAVAAGEAAAAVACKYQLPGSVRCVAVSRRALAVVVARRVCVCDDSTISLRAAPPMACLCRARLGVARAHTRAAPGWRLCREAQRGTGVLCPAPAAGQCPPCARRRLLAPPRSALTAAAGGRPLGWCCRPARHFWQGSRCAAQRHARTRRAQAEARREPCGRGRDVLPACAAGWAVLWRGRPALRRALLCECSRRPSLLTLCSSSPLPSPPSTHSRRLTHPDPAAFSRSPVCARLRRLASLFALRSVPRWHLSRTARIHHLTALRARS
jgi:hypothetical protein